MTQKEEFFDTVERVVSQLKEIKPNIAVLASLSVLLNKQNTALGEIAQLIKSEPSLTVDVLKISNSSFYHSAIPCKDIESALARLGFNGVRKLVSLILSQNLSSADLYHYDINSDELWAESVTVSFLMEALAPAAQLKPSEAATTGILCKIGRVIINNILDHFNMDIQRDKSLPVTDWEKSVVGFHYGVAGGEMLKDMEFPNEIQETIRYHVELDEKKPSKSLTYLLHYCVKLTDVVGIGFSETDYTIPSISSLRPHLKLSEEAVLAAIAEAKSRYKQLNKKISKNLRALKNDSEAPLAGEFGFFKALTKRLSSDLHWFYLIIKQRRSPPPPLNN